ncbi:unnamed protein product [Brassica oleracea var. botrytis]|uniref:Uncharacterized protein n=1 Tax=Brassica oleracea var. oleracea TaxID=109376 RepID=A0A0D3BBU7_BRAOL
MRRNGFQREPAPTVNQLSCKVSHLVESGCKLATPKKARTLSLDEISFLIMFFKRKIREGSFVKQIIIMWAFNYGQQVGKDGTRGGRSDTHSGSVRVFQIFGYFGIEV